MRRRARVFVGSFSLTVLAVIAFSLGSVSLVHAQRSAPARQLQRTTAVSHSKVVPPPVSCSSGTNNWTGSAKDNQWTTASNWSTGAVPVSTDNVCLASTFTTAITIGTLAATNQTISSLTSGAPLSMTSGPLAVSGAATFNDLAMTNGTLTLNGTSSINTLEHSAGTMSGTGTWTVSGILTWSGGTESGSGTTNANGGMALSGEPFLDTRTLNNAKTANWTGVEFLMLDGAVLNNQSGATWNHQGDSQIVFAGGATPTYNNAGTFEKTSGTNTSGGGVGSGVTFNNSGSVQANSGILLFNQLGSCTTTCGGTWSTSAGSTLELGSGATAAGLSGGISGAGAVSFTTGTVNYTGAYNVTGGTSVTGGTGNFNAGAVISSVGPLNLSGGTLNFSTGSKTAIAASTLTQSAGTLTGVDTLTVSGMLTWSGGTESGSGTTNANGGMALSGEPFLDTRTLNNAKTANWTGVEFLMLDGAVFNNHTGATWNHQGDSQIVFAGGATPTYNNAGTFEKTSGTDTTGGGFSTGITVNNSGTIIAKSGFLLLGSLFTQTKGSTLLEGGNIGSSSGAGTLAVNGGSVLGSGTITGAITNTGGTVSPSLASTKPATGTLSVTGSGTGFYTQGVKGTLLLDIGGSSAGKFDVLNVSGAATLAGTADLCLVNGFKPAIGTVFPGVVNYASETGTFSAVNFGWTLGYGATSISATYNGAPLDMFSPATLAFPSQLIHTTSSPLTLTLTNSGQGNLTINSITKSGTGGADYAITAQTCSAGTVLTPGGKCTLTVTFTPSAMGSRPADITVADDACGSPHVIPLSGKGTEMTLAPSPVNFGSQTVGTTSAAMAVTVTNNGTTAVKVTGVTITGTNKTDFKITNNGCTTVAANGGTCTIDVTFTPGAAGARTGTLSVTDNDKGSPQTDVLQGTGS